MQLEELPPFLRERSRCFDGTKRVQDGELVLYWMHHAVRGHENPALEVAVAVAQRLSLPLLVYQGLAGRHRFNSDRHHTFILEGARDAHAELAGAGVRAVFHLPADPSAPSPLPGLASRAAVVITEDFPAPPFPAWSWRLAQATATPMWLVDCDCVLPMQLQGGPFARAFEFRRRNAEFYGERVPRNWADFAPEVEPYEGELGFQPLDLAAADIPELCARCVIDHALGPIPHTRGGSEAGYQRWRQFLEDGLGSYRRLRNDAALAWPRGVSRLSPYLHHGHVSPFRIAREASARGGSGAEKFLDELLIWRELAHNFCVHVQEPEALGALPEWARSTLEKHRDDPRPRRYSLETLERGRTGDKLWDLAQRSLSAHGELHNNLRMTWAKAIPGWTASPESALGVLVELNHRFALDGSDPNSYGGLLWALGLFDRPFSPARPVTGKLRTRSTEAHARRLDLAQFGDRVRRPASGRVLRVAVLGAGISGLAAARALHDQGHRVSVFEKSRGRGGRAATRRLEGLSIDHGAQYFTARDPRFHRVVEQWCERGLVMPWRGKLGVFDGNGLSPVQGSVQRWVAVPGMSALGAHLAEDLEVCLQTRAGVLRLVGNEWQLADESGTDLGAFDLVLVATPAPQAVPLLEASPELARQADTARYSPCWAVMLGFADPLPSDYDGVFCNAGPLRWIARHDSKPERFGNAWVLHANAEWSAENLETPADQVIEALYQALGQVLGQPLTTPLWARAHRWRYALNERSLEVGCLWDPRRRIGACGDWANGARIEGAYLSGVALAGRALGAVAAACNGRSRL